jgi:glycosyltransferase involved in cell wall biosynthesis
VYARKYNILYRKRKLLNGGRHSLLNYIISLPIDVFFSSLLLLSGLGCKICYYFWQDNVNRTTIVDIPGSDLPGEVGSIEGNRRLVFEERDNPGIFVYGPYCRLEKGLYEVRLQYEVSGSNTKEVGNWDICFNCGTTILRKGNLAGRGKCEIIERVIIGEELSGAPLEFRIWYKGKGNLFIDRLIVDRLTKSEVTLTSSSDKLAQLANRYSNADVFLVPIVVLSNALGIMTKKVVAVHDLCPIVYYDNFLQSDASIAGWIRQYIDGINEFAVQGVFFCSNSDFVRKTHTLRHVQGVVESRTGYVFLPANVPTNIDENILEKALLCQKYGIKNPYLFYPTQIRPYKNILILVQAFRKLLDEGKKLQLVLTGAPEHVPAVAQYIYEHKLTQHVILTGDVSEIELYSLHYYAAVVVVCTLFEGGFPWQAMEGMSMNSPVILARTPVVEERLQHEGFDPQTCGLTLFEPYDYAGLAEKIKVILDDPDKAVLAQKEVRDKLLSYTWDDASQRYWQIFFGSKTQQG